MDPNVQNQHNQDPNPPLLITDADALLQLLIADQVRLLGFMRRTFNMQPAVTEAVEMEIRKSRKFRARFTKALDEALDRQTLVVLDPRTLPAYVTTDPNAVYDSIQTVGARYERSGLDYGEAYTFAAGVVLQVPVVSNDITAIEVAQKKGLQLPSLVARVFDLIVLGHQAGHLGLKDCDEVRKALAREAEFLPASFRKRSFEGGLTTFYPRLQDGSNAPVGAVSASSILDKRFVLVRAMT
jgi:hypothetical protein